MARLYMAETCAKAHEAILNSLYPASTCPPLTVGGAAAAALLAALFEAALLPPAGTRFSRARDPKRCQDRFCLKSASVRCQAALAAPSL
jgi:hypothetical protein